MPRLKEQDRQILGLAVPAFAALVAEPAFLLADSAIVGHLGTLPLAGLGIAAAVLSTVVGLCVFLAYGTTAGVARRLGADALRGALALGPLSDSLRAMATQLVHAQSDPGDPPAADDVLDLQAAASDALFALSRGLDESAGLLRVSAHGYRGAEEDGGRTLRRRAGEGP